MSSRRRPNRRGREDVIQADAHPPTNFIKATAPLSQKRALALARACGTMEFAYQKDTPLMKLRIMLTALALTLIAAPASADEVWSLPSGNQLVYDRDVGDTAVLTYVPEQGDGRGQIFVVGLAGQYEGRGAYQAYWVENDDAGAACPAALTDAEGNTWRRWGIATISFQRATFPSRITIARGECLNAPSGRITARPVVGAGVR
jgi:hypothetical protein